MNRKTALDIIRAEYARCGRPTQIAMRAYTESRISYGAFMEARREGMQLHQEAQEQ